MNQFLDGIFEYSKTIEGIGVIFFGVFLSLIGLIFLGFFKIIIPMKLRAQKEKFLLEKKNIELLALFAKLDPSGLFRIDEAAVIIEANENAEHLLKSKSIKGEKLHLYFEQLHLHNTKEIIEKELIVEFETKIDDKFYMVFIKGVKEYKFSQVYCYDITQLKNTQNELQVLSIKLEELNAHLITVTEEERSRIAQDLHDGLGQLLISMKMQTERMGNSELLDESIKTDVFRLREVIDSSMRTVREILRDLKPALIKDFGVNIALKTLTEDVSAAGGINIKYESKGLVNRFNLDFEITIYRIVQELLNNAIKHSKASNISIQVVCSADTLQLLMVDDGIGFDTKLAMNAKQNKGLGLFGISERIKRYQGEFFVESIDSGSEFMITVPVTERINKAYVN